MQYRITQRWLKASASAAVLVAAQLVAVASASAADLYNTYPPARSGSAYDDPRYADLYGTPPPRHEAPYKPSYEYRQEYRHEYRHEYRDRHPVPSEPVYRDRQPNQYSEVHPRHRAYSAGPGCLQKDEISLNLERDGWRDFHDPQVIDRGTAFVKARRHGRTFQLKLDRCSGDIIAARPVDHRGPYADYERPYRTY
jgi:hypothetical protein